MTTNTDSKIKLTIAAVLAPAFAPAFNSLCNDNSMSGKDRYALARSLRDVRSHMETFTEQRLEAFKRHGMPEHELVRKQIARATNDTDKARLEQKLADITKEGAVPGWGVDREDAVAYAALQKDLADLQAVEFEVFLDHKVALGNNTKLTAQEIEVLLDLVEFKE